MINFLLNQGADTIFSDITGKTVLHYACILGVSKPVLQLLLDFNNKLDLLNGHAEDALEE